MTALQAGARRSRRGARLLVAAAIVGYLALVVVAAPARRPPGIRVSSESSRTPAAGRPSPRQVIRAEFGRGWLGRCMTSIAWRESRLQPRAVNWSDVHSDGSRGSFGLFQIGAVHRRAGETVSAFARRMLRPAANARAAHRLYTTEGLQPWRGQC